MVMILITGAFERNDTICFSYKIALKGFLYIYEQYLA